MWSNGDASGQTSSGSDSRLEPLLPAEEQEHGAAHERNWWKRVGRGALLGLMLVAYVASGALERVCFTRMTAKMPDDIFLMHTLLAGLSMTLFIVLWMARAQSSRDPIPEQLQRLHPTELLQMAALDTLHTLLALDGAAGLPGTMQAVLLQACIQESNASVASNPREAQLAELPRPSAVAGCCADPPPALRPPATDSTPRGKPRPSLSRAPRPPSTLRRAPSTHCPPALRAAPSAGRVPGSAGQRAAHSLGAGPALHRLLLFLRVPLITPLVPRPGRPLDCAGDARGAPAAARQPRRTRCLRARPPLQAVAVTM